MENKFGKLSELRLVAANNDNRTIIEDLAFTAPFKVMHPFYEKEDFMTVMLLCASAGIMSGDRQEIDIQVRSRARLEFVSQAYEKIYRMQEGYAERHIHLGVEADASLYYTPLPVIPFAGSDFLSTADIELEDATSRFIFREILTCGRAAHGEEFRYRRFQNRISVYQGGKIVYRDNTCYEPERIDMRGFGMYEGYTHLANLLLCNIPHSREKAEEMRQYIDGCGQVEGGVTVTAVGHVVVRMLGKRAQQLTDLMEKMIRIFD